MNDQHYFGEIFFENLPWSGFFMKYSDSNEMVIFLLPDERDVSEKRKVQNIERRNRNDLYL